MKNVINNKYFWFPKKLYKIRKTCQKENCLSQGDIQIYLRLFSDRARSFHYNRNKFYKKF